MDGLTLEYTTSTTSTMLDQAPEATEGTVRVGLAANEIVVDDGKTVQRFELERRRVTTLYREGRTAKDSSLLGLVHDRETGMASALHVMEVLRAGGAMPSSATWQAEASYGLSWPHVEDETRAEIERSEVDGGWRWSVGEHELARVLPVAEPPPMPSKSLLRLFSFVLPVHPRIAAELAEAGTLPRELSTDDHLFLRHRVGRYALASIDPGSLDFEAMAQGHAFDPPADETLAQIGKRNEGKPSGFRRDDARAALDRGELVEAILAVFAHRWAHVDNTSELVAAIFARAGWFSAVKRIPSLLTADGPPEVVAKRVAKLEKLRRKAGRYAYVLDVLIGELHLHSGNGNEALAALSRALMQDPELAATWVSLGRVYASLLRFDDAWDCFAHADRLCPEHVVVGEIHRLDGALRARHPHMF